MGYRVVGGGQVTYEGGPEVGAGTWEDFEARLTHLLIEFCGGDVLQFFAPPDSVGATPSCTLRQTHDGFSLVTAVRPAVSEIVVAYQHKSILPPIVEAVVQVCREEFGVPAPGLLTLRAMGAVTRDARILQIPTEHRAHAGCDPVVACARPDDAESIDVAYLIEDPVELRGIVASVVEKVADVEPGVDSDGDLVFVHDGQAVYIGCAHATPEIRIWSAVVAPVRSRRDAAVHAAILNRNNPGTSWILDGAVLAQCSIVNARPYVASHLYTALSTFLRVLSATADDVRFALGDDEVD